MDRPELMRRLLETFKAGMADQPGWSVLQVQPDWIAHLGGRWDDTFALVHESTLPNGSRPCIWINACAQNTVCGSVGVLSNGSLRPFPGWARPYRLSWWLAPGRWGRDWYRKTCLAMARYEKKVSGWFDHEDLYEVVDATVAAWQERVGRSRAALMLEVLKDRPNWESASYKDFPAVGGLEGLTKMQVCAVQMMAVAMVWDEGEDDLPGRDAKPILANCRRIVAKRRPAVQAHSLIAVGRRGTRRPSREALMRARAIHHTLGLYQHEHARNRILWAACRWPKQRAKHARMVCGTFGWASSHSCGDVAKNGVRVGPEVSRCEFTVTWTEIADAAVRGRAPAPGRKWHMRRHWGTNRPPEAARATESGGSLNPAVPVTKGTRTAPAVTLSLF